MAKPKKNEEAKLQNRIVTWFSQTYPELYGLLIEANNDTYSRNHAMKRRGMGMIPGVADLLLIAPGEGRLVGIELKAPGSYHSVQKIKTQREWGKILIHNGGLYIMTCSEEFAKAVISHAIGGIEQAKIRASYQKKEWDTRGGSVLFYHL